MRAAAAVVAVATVLATGCGGGADLADDTRAGTPAVALHGTVPAAPSARPELDLVDTSGRPYDFRARTRGRVTLLYVGYTHCVDDCPTTMADIATALRRLPPATADAVTVVFVTTDPWRDDGPTLRRWLDRFRPRRPYVGLTGTPTQVAGAAVALGMPISHLQPAPGSSGSGRYAGGHIAAVLVYDRADRLATLYPPGVAPADIATDLQVLVKG